MLWKNVEGIGFVTMPFDKPEYLDILAAKKAYANGENIAKFLKQQLSQDTNTADIIEISYDILAGSYIEAVKKDREKKSKIDLELSEIIQQFTKSTEFLLDVGTGEMTTLTGVLNKLPNPPRTTLAFDISWSRISKGLEYTKELLEAKTKLNAFVGDIGAIPLRNASMDVVISYHALEPNGGRLELLMFELFRVAKEKLLLFEPCYELNSDEGKRRMDEHGYIKNVDDVVASLGGKMIEKVELKNLTNPLSPKVVCFVIEPPKGKSSTFSADESFYSVPGTDIPLVLRDNFYFSNDAGLSYPILCGIPVLRKNSGILCTGLVE